jgi:lysophospholipase L1-like esterase
MDIDAFNAINKAETDKQGVAYIDITTISKKAATDASLNASDGLHPSAVDV